VLLIAVISFDPGQGCGCVYIYPLQASPKGQCICECYDPEDKTGKITVTIGDVVKSMPIRKYNPGFKTTARTKMDVCTTNFPAAALAEILDRILPDKILDPAKHANVRIKLRSKKSNVSEIVKSAGFILKR
jgi:hypothetical protein